MIHGLDKGSTQKKLTYNRAQYLEKQDHNECSGKERQQKRIQLMLYECHSFRRIVTLKIGFKTHIR